MNTLFSCAVVLSVALAIAPAHAAAPKTGGLDTTELDSIGAGVAMGVASRPIPDALRAPEPGGLKKTAEHAQHVPRPKPSRPDTAKSSTIAAGSPSDTGDRPDADGVKEAPKSTPAPKTGGLAATELSAIGVGVGPAIDAHGHSEPNGLKETSRTALDLSKVPTPKIPDDVGAPKPPPIDVSLQDVGLALSGIFKP